MALRHAEGTAFAWFGAEQHRWRSKSEAFQADCAGSIPVTRSTLDVVEPAWRHRLLNDFRRLTTRPKLRPRPGAHSLRGGLGRLSKTYATRASTGNRSARMPLATASCSIVRTSNGEDSRSGAPRPALNKRGSPVAATMRQS